MKRLGISGIEGEGLGFCWELEIASAEPTTHLVMQAFAESMV